MGMAVMILAVLYLLAAVDGAFCGYRSASRRSAPLDKRACRQAMLRGTLWAQIAAVIALGAVALVWKLAPLRTGLVSDLQHAALRMLVVLGPFAAVVLAIVSTRGLSSTEARRATGATVSGRLAALRPLAAVVAVSYGIIPASRWETRALGVLVLALMLALEPLLDRIAELQPTTP